MPASSDPLLEFRDPDRLAYSTGELLGADDFRLEQTYHRGRLARALLYLHGSGTLAGLEATATPQAGPTPGQLPEVELEVAPGLAVDAAGRLVEVPRPCCLRLRRWFEFIASTPQGAADLRSAWRPSAPGSDAGAVVADLFLAFHACPRGFTPAFATGPFDALDAAQPSRVRDAFELSLALRKEQSQPLPAPADPWQGVTQALLAARIFSAWSTFQPSPQNDPGPHGERPDGVDAAAVLLARVRIPAAKAPDANSSPQPDWSAAAWPSANLDNLIRPFVVPPAALRRLAGF